MDAIAGLEHHPELPIERVDAVGVDEDGPLALVEADAVGLVLDAFVPDAVLRGVQTEDLAEVRERRPERGWGFLDRPPGHEVHVC